MVEFRYVPMELFSKYYSYAGGTINYGGVNSGTVTSVVCDSVGRICVTGQAPTNSSTSGLYPLLIGGYDTTGSLVPLAITSKGLKVDTELEVTGTLIANLYTFKDYSSSIQAALVDSNRRIETVLASGTNLAGTLTAHLVDRASGTALTVESATYPNLRTSLYYHNNIASINQVNIDSASENEYALLTKSHLMGYDGGAYDRLRTTSASAGGTMPSQEGILGVGLFGRVSGTEFHALPQEAVSPHELQISINQSNIQVPSDLQSRYYTNLTLWSSSNTTAGSTNTYSDISIEYYKTKTVGIYVSAASTVLVDVSFSGTTTFWNYQNENASANTLKVITFTDAMEYAQVRVVTPSASTLSGHLSRLV